MSSIILSQSLNQDSNGSLNLTWTTSGVIPANIRDVILVYYSNSPGSMIQSLDVEATASFASLNLDSGSVYNFQLQISSLDPTTLSNFVTNSNLLSLTAPYSLSKPTIVDSVAINNGMVITLSGTTNSLRTGTDNVEFVMRRVDNVLFYVTLAYASSNVYTLTSINDSRITNYQSYTVACMYSGVSNSLYNSASPMSNTVQCVPNDKPNVAQNVSLGITQGASVLSLDLTWSAPSDFSFYSSSFYVMLSYSKDAGVSWTTIQLPNNSDPQVYTLSTQLQRGFSYMGKVQYYNQYGLSDGVITNNVLPESLADVIDVSVISTVAYDKSFDIFWSAPSYTGQTPLTSYLIYVDGWQHLSTTDNKATISTLTNAPHINGKQYFIEIVSINRVGMSARSSYVYVTPYGNVKINYTILTGTSMTVSISPNGKVVTSVLVVGIPITPVSSEAPFIKSIDVSAFSAQIDGMILVKPNFETFTSPIASYVVIVNGTDNGSAYHSNIAGI